MGWLMFPRKLPLITCVMVTKGRPSFIKKSISCFLKQTYPIKNLLIVSQGNEIVNEEIKSLLPDNVNFYTANPKISLGSMRNLSVELANGDIICQWDDDDLSHPDRLMTQYKELSSSDHHVASMYTQFLKYFTTNKFLYWCDWSGEKTLPAQYICNTLMLKKEVFGTNICYPETGPQSNVEEDLNLLGKLLGIGEVAKVTQGYQFVYVYHGKNVYDLDHHLLTLITETGKKVMDKEFLFSRKFLINQTIRETGIEAIVRSLEEEVCIHEI